jgi:starvation-inducible outer membrane lipoprotein
MRLLTLAVLLTGGVLLQSCSTTPPRTLTAEEQIIQSIVRAKQRDVTDSCSGARYCTGQGKQQMCRCVNTAAVQQMLNARSY